MLDAIDRFFQRRADGLPEHRRVRAGIDGADGDGRWSDFRILTDRQGANGKQPRGQNDDG